MEVGEGTGDRSPTGFFGRAKQLRRTRGACAGWGTPRALPLELGPPYRVAPSSTPRTRRPRMLPSSSAPRVPPQSSAPSATYAPAPAATLELVRPRGTARLVRMGWGRLLRRRVWGSWEEVLGELLKR
jgi:hypothetical protein